MIINAQQCEAHKADAKCGNSLFYTEPLKIARCKRSRVWVENMKACKLGLWKREPIQRPPSEAAALRRQGKDPNCMKSYL